MKYKSIIATIIAAVLSPEVSAAGGEPNLTSGLKGTDSGFVSTAQSSDLSNLSDNTFKNLTELRNNLQIQLRQLNSDATIVPSSQVNSAEEFEKLTPKDQQKIIQTTENAVAKLTKINETVDTVKRLTDENQDRPYAKAALAFNDKIIEQLNNPQVFADIDQLLITPEMIQRGQQDIDPTDPNKAEFTDTAINYNMHISQLLKPDTSIVKNKKAELMDKTYNSKISLGEAMAAYVKINDLLNVVTKAEQSLSPEDKLVVTSVQNAAIKTNMTFSMIQLLNAADDAQINGLLSSNNSLVHSYLESSGIISEESQSSAVDVSNIKNTLTDKLANQLSTTELNNRLAGFYENLAYQIDPISLPEKLREKMTIMQQILELTGKDAITNLDKLTQTHLLLLMQNIDGAANGSANDPQEIKSLAASIQAVTNIVGDPKFQDKAEELQKKKYETIIQEVNKKYDELINNVPSTISENDKKAIQLELVKQKDETNAKMLSAKDNLRQYSLQQHEDLVTTGEALIKQLTALTNKTPTTYDEFVFQLEPISKNTASINEITTNKALASVVLELDKESRLYTHAQEVVKRGERITSKSDEQQRIVNRAQQVIDIYENLKESFIAKGEAPWVTKLVRKANLLEVVSNRYDNELNSLSSGKSELLLGSPEFYDYNAKIENTLKDSFPLEIDVFQINPKESADEYITRIKQQLNQIKDKVSNSQLTLSERTEAYHKLHTLTQAIIEARAVSKTFPDKQNEMLNVATIVLDAKRTLSEAYTNSTPEAFKELLAQRPDYLNIIPNALLEDKISLSNLETFRNNLNELTKLQDSIKQLASTQDTSLNELKSKAIMKLKDSAQMLRYQIENPKFETHLRELTEMTDSVKTVFSSDSELAYANALGIVAASLGSDEDNASDEFNDKLNELYTDLSKGLQQQNDKQLAETKSSLETSLDLSQTTGDGQLADIIKQSLKVTEAWDTTAKGTPDSVESISVLKKMSNDLLSLADNPAMLTEKRVDILRNLAFSLEKITNSTPESNSSVNAALVKLHQQVLQETETMETGTGYIRGTIARLYEKQIRQFASEIKDPNEDNTTPENARNIFSDPNNKELEKTIESLDHNYQQLISDKSLDVVQLRQYLKDFNIKAGKLGLLSLYDEHIKRLTAAANDSGSLQDNMKTRIELLKEARESIDASSNLTDTDIVDYYDTLKEKLPIGSSPASSIETQMQYTEQLFDQHVERLPRAFAALYGVIAEDHSEMTEAKQKVVDKISALITGKLDGVISHVNAVPLIDAYNDIVKSNNKEEISSASTKVDDVIQQLPQYEINSLGAINHEIADLVSTISVSEAAEGFTEPTNPKSSRSNPFGDPVPEISRLGDSGNDASMQPIEMNNDLNPTEEMPPEMPMTE